MDVRVLGATGSGVTLEAPLEPNLNHRDTAFGGSVAALAILAGWTLIHERLRDEGIEGMRTVIQRSEVRYVAPADGPFRATCAAPEPEVWSRFLRTFERRGRARVVVGAEVMCRGALAATFRGAYGVLGPSDGI
jgi:thioesterase domain-containing protein